MDAWDILGVAPDIAPAELRRRYAALIKAFRPETHPQEFARIRAAYELALRAARARAAQAGAPGEDTAAPAKAPGADTAPVPAEDRAATPPASAAASGLQDDADGSPAAGENADVPTDAPTLGELFHQFMEVAHPVGGSQDEALRPLLRALLRARQRASLDDSQMLEFSLLRWFLESDRPALTMLFEAGHAFGWHEHPDRLAAWLSQPAMRRIEGLLALSRDLVFARHYSGNAWLRRLHRPPRGVVPVAWRPATLEALGWALRWRQLAAQTAPALADGLQARAQRRLQGAGLLSTDLLAGLVAACAATRLVALLLFAEAPGSADLGATFVLVAALVGLLSCGLRQAARRASRSTAVGWMQPLRARLAGHGAKVVGAIVGLLLASMALLGATDHPLAAGMLMVCSAPFGAALLLWLAWRMAAITEIWAASLSSWRSAVDRLEFQHMLRDREALHPAAPPQRPYGPRLRWRERLHAIGQARRWQERELAQGARPALPRVVLNLGGSARPGWPRMVWIALWVAFGLARVTHLIGASH